MAAQLVHFPSTSIVPQTSDQMVALAVSDALTAIRSAQQEFLQLFEKLKSAFDRVVQENVDLRKEIVVLRGVVETQNKVHNDQMQALSGQIDGVQKLASENAKQLNINAKQLNALEEKTDREMKQLRNDAKAAHNDHVHRYDHYTAGMNATTAKPNVLL